MDYHRFASLASVLTSIPSRRHVLSGLTGLGLALGTSHLPDDAAAKKKRKRKKRKGKKGKGKGKGKNPPVCTPSCAGNSCGADDGCGGTCGCEEGSVCHDGACRACTVTCDGNGAACSDALKTALASGGTIYACPGRYIGNFEVTSANLELVGAGDGDNPETSTILDANQSGRVVLVKSGSTAALHGLRITGGSLTNDLDGGGGIRNEGTLTLTACTVSKNTAGFGAGIAHVSAQTLTLNASTISENTADQGGGIFANIGPVVINGGAIRGNRALAHGAGIANFSTSTVNGGVIKGNRAKSVGGGLFNQGTITFDSASRITGNIAEGGGGIFNQTGSTVNLNGATIATNVPDNCSPEDSVPGCSG